MARHNEPDEDSFDFSFLDVKADKSFGDFVAYEKPRRIGELALTIHELTYYRSAQYLATQPVRIRKNHPSFGQAARCGEILTGCDSSIVTQVHIDPGKEGKWKKNEVPWVTIMVCTSDRRWHEAPNVTIDRLIGAWVDARQ